MSKMIIDRELLESPLTGIEFAAYLSAADLGTVWRDNIVLCDISIYYNMTGKMPNPKQRVDLNEALLELIGEGYLVAEVVTRGVYLIDCKKSFLYDLDQLPRGGTTIIFDNVRKIIASDKYWQGMLRYYLMLVSHQRNGKACAFSRQYFSQKLGICELTLSKYNTKLKELGVIDVVRRKNSTSIYKIT